MENLKKLFTALHRREQIALGIAILIMAGSAIWLTVIVVATSTKVVPARGGIYKEGVLGQPQAVNPVFASTEPDTDLLRLTFSSLTQLADHIESDATKRIWNVRLKEDLVWSDNAKLTSDDAIFTVERIQDPESRSPFFSSWQGVTAQRVSELEIQFTLVAPYPFFEEQLSRLYPVPKHIFAETPSSNWRLSDYLLAPVGSGPYQFKKYDRKSNGFITAYHLETNSHYFGAPPYLSTITFLFFPDEQSIVAAFNAGSIDGFGTFSGDLPDLATRPHALTEFSLPSYYAVFFNQGQNLALKDVDVRNALGLAVDRTRLVREVLLGYGNTVSDPIMPHATQETVSPSLEVVRQALDAAGWHAGEDGVREKKIKGGSVRLEFTLTVPDITLLSKSATTLQEIWTQVGASVHLRILSADEVANRVLKTRDYQALLFGNTVEPPHDLYPFWHSNERFSPGLNLALYNSKRADSILIQLRRDASDLQDKQDTLRKIFSEDMPAIFLFSPHYLLVTRKDLRGIAAGSMNEPEDRFLALPQWHLNTTRTRVTQ